MDGWGLRDDEDANAVAMANTPVVDGLWQKYPHTALVTSGRAVGLPDGQMGNSEVGHLNLGAGRVVDQEIVRITKSIGDGEFFEKPLLLETMGAVREKGTLHIMGLVSGGGVHSSLGHLFGLLEMAKRQKVGNVAVHAIMDGRDTSPTSGRGFLEKTQAVIDTLGTGRIATVVGRYYSMDRDKRWDRVQIGYDAYTLGKGEHTTDCRAALQASYDDGVTDEFVKPIVVVDEQGAPVATINDGDAIVFFNFRADRARQIARAFTEKSFDGFDRERSPSVKYTCMTEYDRQLGLPVVFPPVHLEHILAEAAASDGRRGLRIAETEKYAHVTYFFNGGEEDAYQGEDRILIPSPKVATYDLQPEMNATEVADKLIAQLEKRQHDYIICNFANPDMVGHTGVLEAAIRAVETVDGCVGRVLGALDLSRDVVIVTSDHGNAEMMVDPETGGPYTAHTTNPVPCILVDEQYGGDLLSEGSLRDIAPTICNYLGIPVPEEMTGRDLRSGSD